MKKLFFLVSFLGVLTYFNAQTVDVGNPVGWNGKLIDKDIPIQSMPGYNQAIIDQEDAVDDLAKNKPWRFGLSLIHI